MALIQILFGFGFIVGLGLYISHVNQLSKIPGPLLSRFFPVWMVKTLLTGRLNYELAELHEKHGDVVRIGPSELSFATLSAHDTIHNSISSFTKDGAFQWTTKAIGAPPTTFSIQQDPRDNRELRRLFQPALTDALKGGNEHFHRLKYNELMRKTNIAPGSSKAVDLGVYIDEIVWDVIGNVTLGQATPQTLIHTWELLKKNSNWLTCISEVVSFVLTRRGFCALTNLAHAAGLQRLIGIDPLILIPSARDPKNRLPLLSRVPPESLKQHRVRTEMLGNVVAFIVAAAETTAGTSRAVFYCLLKHPECYQRLREEVRAALTCGVDDITDLDLLRLPYLTGCINEALRLYPGLNGKFANRISMGATIDGVYIPAGVAVSADIFSIHRSPKYWKYPNEFRPERWLDGTGFTDHKAAFRPFSTGPRQCPGRQMALQMMRLTVAKFMLEFDLRMERSLVWERDVRSGVLWEDSELWVRLTRDI